MKNLGYAGKGVLKTRFDAADSARSEILERARTCAAMSKPWVLPPLGQTADARLPQAYQSLGARGMTNLEGKMLMALYPPDVPWFSLELSAEVKYDPSIPTERLQQAEQVLFLNTLTAISKLEAANLKGESAGYRHRSGFRARKRLALSQLLITGDVLEYLSDDYRLKVFRRDQYVTGRDSSGDVLYHGTVEKIDIRSLPDDILVKAKVRNIDKLMEKPVGDRMAELYTFVDYHPVTSRWIIQQELNGHVVNESEETVSPYFCTSFELAPGEDYGRGFMEQNLGDFTTLDQLGEKFLDFAAAASKLLTVLDYSCATRDTDVAKSSGSVIRAKVSAGEVQDIAFLKLDKLADFKVVYDVRETVRKDLGQAMLLENEAAPSGESGRSPVAWQTITKQLDGALGGFYAPIADDQQVPLLRRLFHQLRRDRLVLELPENVVEIRVLTGIAALSKAQKATGIMSYAQAIAALGPEVMAKLDGTVVADVLARLYGIDEPGMVKTNEQVAAEQQRMLRLAAQQAATEQAISTTGNIIENNATTAQSGAAAQ